MKILFVASLHHPEQLQRDRQHAQAQGHPAPVFPTSMNLHFWERVLRQRGHTITIFWRNLSGFGSGDISDLQAETYTERITPRRILTAINQRLPYRLNPDLRRRNMRLMAQARRERPDILWMIGDNRVIAPDTLAQIKREIGCRVIYLSGTSPIVFSHQMERAAARLYDCVLVNDYYHGMQWRELGAKQMLCLPYVAIDPDFHQPRPAQPDYACDVSFVGTLLPEHLYSERVAALAALRDFDLGIWSVHDVPAVLRSHRRGYALGATMLDVIASSTLTINAHGDFMRYGGNMRLFEAASVGTLQLVDDRPGVREWFSDGENIVIYRDPDDLREKVAHYLAHPDDRARIAHAAREHVRAHHTYEQRLQALQSQGIL